MTLAASSPPVVDPSPPRSPRRTALVVVLISGAAFALLAWWRVPWDAVPGGRLVPADAASHLSSAQIARAESYSRWARVWSWGSLALSLAIAAWWGFSSIGRRVVDRLPGPRWVRSATAVVLTLLLGRVLTLPFAVALHLHMRHYGLTDQGWAGFARDVAVGEGVQIVATAIAVLALLACMRRWPRRWPAVAGSLLAALVMLGSFVYPVLIEPLSNHFTSLPDGELRTGILRLAEIEHVHIDDVLVADASRRTTTLNAYVSGFGDTRRVVLYDTLVDDLDRREVLSVVAHELTHARHDDVLTGSLLGACGAAFGVGLLGLVLGRRRRHEPIRPGEPGDHHEICDPREVPRLLALFAVASFLALPVQNTISRAIETRADVGALEATHDPRAFIAMQEQLATHSLNDPTPPALSQFWFGSHPTTLQRIALAERFESLDR